MDPGYRSRSPGFRGCGDAPEVIMIVPKIITGDKFIAGLLELGIVDNKTKKVVITAEVGEVITLDIERFGDDRLLQLLKDGSVTIAHNRLDAVAR